MNEDENVIWRGFEARIERLEDVVRDLDDMLRGNSRKRVIGLQPEYDRIDHELRRLNAVIFTDSTGKHGLAHDVDVLMGRQAGVDRRSEFRWKYWAPTLLALLALAVTFLTNLDKIMANLPQYHPAPLEEKIDQAKHPRGKKIVRYRVIHQDEAPSEATKDSNLP